MKLRITILLLSIIYCGYLLAVLTANHYKSTFFNSLNSEYYYQGGFLSNAIEAEPTKAEYHMHYGLELLKTLPKDKFSAQNQLRLAKKELFRAVKLKAYNELYNKTYNTYAVWIDSQL